MPCPPARGLLEAHPAVADLRLVLDRRQRDRGDAQLSRAELEARYADVPSAQVAAICDVALVAELDERPQLVGLAERVCLPQRVEILDHARRRVVVVGDADREREFRQALDGLRRDPRDCGDGRFDAHGTPFAGDMGINRA